MKPSLLFNYDYAMTPYSHRQPWSPAFQLQEALREYFDVYRRDEINLSSADFVFNAPPIVAEGGQGIDLFLKGKKTAWWDVLPLEHIDRQYFDRCDVVFYNTPSFADEYPQNKRVLLMEAVDTWGYYRQPATLDYDLGFLGSEVVGYRIDLLNLLSKKYKMLRGQMEMGPISSRELSRCKLVLSIQDYWEKNAYIERRTFTFGNVRPILIHMNRDYMSVGDPYLDYIPYTDEASLISQIDYYLANDKEREQIGNNMILNLKENHTNQIRAKTVYQAFCTL